MYNKYDYVCHISILKFFIEMGCNVEILEMIKFEQSRFLNDFIMFNTNKRQLSQTESEKDMCKLMNNATMENF